jgi:Bacteriophage lambda head decoration protein D
MTDISVESRGQFTTDDRPWLLFEAVGHQQPVATDFGVLDFTKFTANTHYPNGFIPSGILLGRVTTGGRLGPYSNSASDGRETAVGFLYNATKVPANTATKVAAAVVDAFAVVSESRLPTNHGLDAAAKAELPLIKFRG